jgi:acetolactate synthase-1/2/3 large subunit
VVSVFCRRVVNPADIVSALPEAIAAAKSGGPAVLLLPKNVQQSKIELNNSGQLLKRLVGDPYPVAQALRRAVGPVTIIAGEQVARDDARAELEHCAQRCGRGWPPCPTPGRRRNTPRVIVGARRDGRDGHPSVAAAVADSAGVCWSGRGCR